MNFFLNAAGRSLSPEYNAWVARVIAQGFTVPIADAARIDRFIKSYKRGGAGWSQTPVNIWDDTYAIWIPAMDSPDAWKVNIKSPTLYEVTEQGGALNKNADGVAGTGANAANTNLTPSAVFLDTSDPVLIGQASLSIWGYFREIVGGMFGTENTTLNRIRLIISDYALNSGRKVHPATEQGFWLLNHDFSSNHKWFNDEFNDGTGRVVGTLPNVPLYFSGRNNNGSLVSHATRTSVFGASKRLVGDELTLFAITDEYLRGPWPFTKTFIADITPSVDGAKDYPAFPGLFWDGTALWLDYRFGPDHNIAGGVDLILRSSSDKINFSTPEVVVTDALSQRVTLTGSGPGFVELVINGVVYTVTYNISLTQTAIDFVTANSATLSGLGITVTSSTNFILIEKLVGITPLVVTSQNPSGIGATVNPTHEVFNDAYYRSGTREFYFFNTNYTYNSAVRIPWFVYRDNGGAWSAWQKLTTDFEPDGQAAGPSAPWKDSAGNLYKPYYGRTTGSGFRQVYIYKSLAASNGLAWTQEVIIAPEATYPGRDYEEPQAWLELTNNKVYLTLRSDPLRRTDMVICDEDGSNQTPPVYFHASIGKNPIVSDGTHFYVYGRAVENLNTLNSRAKISYVSIADWNDYAMHDAYDPAATYAIGDKVIFDRYSYTSTANGNIGNTPSGLVNWVKNINPVRSRYLDDNTGWYMYGGLAFPGDAVYGVHSVETLNDYQSPTNLKFNKFL